MYKTHLEEAFPLSTLKIYPYIALEVNKIFNLVNFLHTHL